MSRQVSPFFHSKKNDALVDDWKQFRSETLPADCHVELPGESSDVEPIGQRPTEFWSHIVKMEHLNGSPKYPCLRLLVKICLTFAHRNSKC